MELQCLKKGISQLVAVDLQKAESMVA